MEKKLYRSSKNRMLGGVCGGVAEYFGLDSTLVRLGWAFLVCFGGTGLVAYIICAIVIPNENIAQ
jgi:phage shock protein C